MVDFIYWAATLMAASLFLLVIQYGREYGK